ncbi:pantetheine-phosphate adenylyltransferase [Gemmiger sp. An120]|uniref:pantetheine-phosphate adenylyltransferase n=1 Tax=Gemmiger TaxID=204475 RepID=UPI000B375AB0|nr:MULTISPECIES: pantetheine-phosphate adenylyltransferase [Gemmiger]MBM6913973.1 pantetheine-phosphate adenylyltransferase [Gemmiger formicilis]OUQ40990.1 pantetheine-phosphate adenylyltransferase [Gemmiger sp. An120]
MITAVYPGSFDPVTLGHMDIITRASRVVDKLVIGILINKKKTPLFTTEERLDMLRHSVAQFSNVTVETFDGMTVEFAKRNGASVIIRGLRAVTDFESEMQIAQINHEIEPTVDTMFFTTSLQYAYLSSTMAKEVASYGSEVSHFVNPYVAECLRKKFAQLG